MDEFGLTLMEVRNKIRIYRTTYSQERKKEETIMDHKPRLSWYNDMKQAFTNEKSKVKSFQKSTTKKQKLSEDSLMQITYEDVEEDELESEDLIKNDISKGKIEAIDETGTQIIIEPYEEEEEYEEEEYTEIHNPASNDEHQQQEMIDDSKKESIHTLYSSNELFLQSLKSTFDKLSDEKNMRARIKIQELLYQIMYEN
jgi:hypothetical protein